MKIAASRAVMTPAARTDRLPTRQRHETERRMWASCGVAAHGVCPTVCSIPAASGRRMTRVRRWMRPIFRHARFVAYKNEAVGCSDDPASLVPGREGSSSDPPCPCAPFESFENAYLQEEQTSNDLNHER
jgi:hypothetical protein